jgi:hypothetical protein
MEKVKMVHDTISSVSIGGVQYDAADGVFEIAAEHVEQAREVGLVLAPAAKAKK